MHIYNTRFTGIPNYLSPFIQRGTTPQYSATPGDNPLICNTNRILFPLFFVALPMTLKNNAGIFQQIFFETPPF
jgi:hypothetical protein